MSNVATAAPAEPDDDGEPLGPDADPGKLFGDPAHLRADLVMYRKALREGSVPPLRWDTHKPIKELAKEIAERGDMTISEQALLICSNAMRDGNMRDKVSAARTVAMMESQNQRDEIAAMLHGENPRGVAEGVTSTPDMIAAMDASIPRERKAE